MLQILSKTESTNLMIGGMMGINGICVILTKLGKNSFPQSLVKNSIWNPIILEQIKDFFQLLDITSDFKYGRLKFLKHYFVIYECTFFDIKLDTSRTASISSQSVQICELLHLLSFQRQRPSKYTRANVHLPKPLVSSS